MTSTGNATTTSRGNTKHCDSPFFAEPQSPQPLACTTHLHFPLTFPLHQTHPNSVIIVNQSVNKPSNHPPAVYILIHLKPSILNPTNALTHLEAHESVQRPHIRLRYVHGVFLTFFVLVRAECQSSHAIYASVNCVSLEKVHRMSLAARNKTR